MGRGIQDTSNRHLGAPGRSEGPDASRVTLNSLVAGLRELGYAEGRNIVIERHHERLHTPSSTELIQAIGFGLSVGHLCDGAKCLTSNSAVNGNC